MKYKPGNKVKIVKIISETASDRAYYEKYLGRVAEIKSTSGIWLEHPYKLKGTEGWWTDRELELVNKEAYVGRRTFRVIKDTPEFKKGALLQEMCDDGDQDYTLLTHEYAVDKDQYTFQYTRVVVEKNPKFFVEVFPIVPEWGTKEEVAKFKKFLKGKK